MNMEKREVTAVDPFAAPVADEPVDQPLARQDLTPEERQAILSAEEVEVPQSARDAIAARLPESWTKLEIDTFIKTYYGKIPEAVDAQAVEEVEALVEEMDESTLPVSSKSRN